MKTIPLTQGKVAIVDDYDYEWLQQWKWHFAVPKPWFGSGKGYARRHQLQPKKQNIYMHREILRRVGEKEFLHTDHINRNPLDNRRINLRPATRGANLINRPPDCNNTTGFKGVTLHRIKGRSDKWRARIRVQGVLKSLGLFSALVEAAKVYNEAAFEYFGDFAYLNEV